MDKAFNNIFWGYLFVLIEIHLFVIDLLPDPIGYWLIFSGISIILKDFPIGHKAKNISLALLVLSIPTVFIQQNSGVDGLGAMAMISGWSFYEILLSWLKIILVFYLFQLIMAIVVNQGNTLLIKRSSRTGYSYLIIMLTAALLNSFIINISGDMLITLTIITVISTLIMEIVFLVLLRSLRQLHLETN